MYSKLGTKKSTGIEDRMLITLASSATLLVFRTLSANSGEWEVCKHVSQTLAKIA